MFKYYMSIAVRWVLRFVVNTRRKTVILCHYVPNYHLMIMYLHVNLEKLMFYPIWRSPDWLNIYLMFSKASTVMHFEKVEHCSLLNGIIDFFLSVCSCFYSSALVKYVNSVKQESTSRDMPPALQRYLCVVYFVFCVSVLSLDFFLSSYCSASPTLSRWI